MKQLVQNLNTGATVLEDVPVPLVGRGQVLIQTSRTLVSPGTERMLVEFGRASLLGKVRQQPERVNDVLNKLRTDGVRPTLEAVFRKLNQPLPLGYSQVGTVRAVGADVTDLRPGDRVISNGHHAEVVCVPRNLVAPVPETVTDDEAVFTVIGAIGLQSVRLINPTLNETIVVIGLGLIGLLTAQLLRINGCRVVGLDVDPARCELARQLGVTALLVGAETDVVGVVGNLTDGIGADGVIITAATNPRAGDELMAQAARMSRKRGRVVLVGVVSLALNRTDFYEKELTFQVSCSYGPGRYDEGYEQRGNDYPLPFVRWTENRNFQTILHLLANGQLQVRPLITDTVPLTDYARVYETLHEPNRIATLLTYSGLIEPVSKRVWHDSFYERSAGVIGLIGAGNFAGSTLLPALKANGVTPNTIASAGGLNAALLGRKFAIPHVSTNYRDILDDPAIDLCLIATQHDTHAGMTVEALRAGKHVFVEKPLAIFDHELPPILDAQQASGRLLMVGFNRRFSAYTRKMKALLTDLSADTALMNVTVTVNAGVVPAGSWQHDRDRGGGRLLGEVGHFIDLLLFLTGSFIRSVCANAMGPHPAEAADSVSLLLRCENGSTGVINYFANGSRAYAKERIEVYAQGRTLVLDNFRRLTGYGWRSFSSMSGRQDKGHAAQFSCLLDAVQTGGPVPIPFGELLNTTQTTLAALHSLRDNGWVDVAGIGFDDVNQPEPAWSLPA